jgi:uncharacterized protein
LTVKLSWNSMKIHQARHIMTEHGMISWTDLNTFKVEEAKAFYAAALGMEFQGFDMPQGTYWVALHGGRQAWGIQNMAGRAPEGAPSHWFTYLAVDDVDRRIEGIEALGGKVMAAPFDIPTVGRIAIVQDASGAMLGWMTPEGMGA